MLGLDSRSLLVVYMLSLASVYLRVVYMLGLDEVCAAEICASVGTAVLGLT